MTVHNEYSRSIPFFEAAPKTTWAAIALSLALRLEGNQNFPNARRILLDEWLALFQAQIVTQRPIDGLGERYE